MTGTYLGAKKILNLEAGLITQKNAMWRQEPVTSDTTYQTMNLWSVASFLDMPLNRQTGTAINAYIGYFHTDYGTNYLRFNGIMNPLLVLPPRPVVWVVHKGTLFRCLVPAASSMASSVI